MRFKWGQVSGKEKKEVRDRLVFVLMILLLVVKESSYKHCAW